MRTIEDRKKELDALDENGVLICPFCGEDEFDYIGLKGHLERWCEEYKNTRSEIWIRARE
jgi:hypothetical protein